MCDDVLSAIDSCEVSFPNPDAYWQAQLFPVVKLTGRKTVREWYALGCADVLTHFSANVPGREHFPPVECNDLVMPQAFFYDNRGLVPEDVNCDAFVLCSQYREKLHALFEGGYCRPISARTGKRVEKWTVSDAATHV